jgi:hypothetical protein
VEEEKPLDGDDLRAIAFLLADIKVAVDEILRYTRGDDEEEEDLPDA